MRKIIAIDFDGTLCEDAWTEIGAAHEGVIAFAKYERQNGAALILWTCRCGELLDAAVAWCRARGLEFDAVNENLPERVALYGTESRKVSADEYWEDKAKIPQYVEFLYRILYGTGESIPVGILEEEGGVFHDAG